MSTQRSLVPTCLRCERGSAAALALIGLTVVMCFGHCALVLVEVRAAQIQAQSTADLAALAAVSTESGCATARTVAEVNRSELISCTTAGLDARVVIRGRALTVAPWLARPSARAHAGFR